jgi:hypothetical protein
MKSVCLFLCYSLSFLLPTFAQEEEPPAPDNELMVQTMNASGNTTRYELVPIGATHCWSTSPCNYSLYPDPPTQSLSLSGNVICRDVGFNVRICSHGDGLEGGGCSTSGNGVGALRYGFYKISIYVNNGFRRHFFYDTRDCGLVNRACGNCSGNDITIRYDVSNDIVWWKNTFSTDFNDPSIETGWSTLSEGQILKYAEIKNCSPRCFQPFWDNGLVVIPRRGNAGQIVPYLVWGPYAGFQPQGFHIYWAITNSGSPTQFWHLADVGPNVTEYGHNGVVVGNSSYRAYYKVQAYTGTTTSGFTNVADIGVSDLAYKSATQGNSSLTVPRYLELENFPNPFNPVTTIRYSLPHDGVISIILHDLLGCEVSAIETGYRTAGTYQISFDAPNLASGVYVHTLTSGNITISKKMIITR